MKEGAAVQTDFLSDMIISRICSAGVMYNDSKANSKRKNRPVWALVIKYEGETVYTSNGRQYVSDINNIALLPKGSSYDWCCTKSGHFAIVEFECQKTCNDIFTFNVKNGEMYLDTVKKTEINRSLKRPGYKLDELRDLYGLISSLLKSSEQKYLPSEKEKKIMPAIEYIAANYDKNISNDELAHLTGLSTVYFRKLFKQVTGTPPINYIQKLKMRKAKEMLKSDYSSIADIACSLGYNNVYEFSKSFKNYVGVSPSMYAKS